MSTDVETQDTPRLINRQLSWLAFNRRVLALAEDETLPYADRMRFVSIWASNLDEYFQVRIIAVKAEAEQNFVREMDDGYDAPGQLNAIRDEVHKQVDAASRIAKQLWTEVRAEGLELLNWTDLTEVQKEELTSFFKRRIFPVLTPLAFDPGHPFPYISTLSLNLGLLASDPDTGERRFARVKIPTHLLGRHVPVLGTESYISLEAVILANLDALFPGLEVHETTFFRVTRNADIEVTAELLDDVDDDLLSAVESGLHQRRFGRVLRLELDANASSLMRQVLQSELAVETSDIYLINGRLDLRSHCAIDGLVKGREGFSLPRIPASVPPAFADDPSPAEMFERISNKDILVFHPYESFDATVVDFIRKSAVDPDVQAIKMTLYRTSGDGEIVDALIKAAHSGKQVVVVVELKARFDEAANIEWARRLETAGVHVAYGFLSLKVHSKVCLVVRREGSQLFRYCHFGTGNYNSSTAKLYSDIGLFTSDPVFGEDASSLFNSLTGFHVPFDYEQLLVAPAGLRPGLVDLIRNEAQFGEDGYIRMTMNSLVDAPMIEELYAASQKGVKVDLVVRGMCCLRPGVKGLSETITVRSILGRYLEHPRIYWFKHGEIDATDGAEAGKNAQLEAAESSPNDQHVPLGPLYLIGSADLMTRNLDRRVETVVPVRAPHCMAQLDDIVDSAYKDDRRAWTLTSTGEWLAPNPQGTYEMQVELHDLRRVR